MLLKDRISAGGSDQTLLVELVVSAARRLQALLSAFFGRAPDQSEFASVM